MSQPGVLTQRSGPQGELLYLILSNPTALNTLTEAMQADLARQIQAAGEDPTVRVLILRGEGTRCFSAGGSMDCLAEMSSPAVREGMYQRGLAVRRALAGLDKPILAAVCGHCIGAAFETAMGCDLLYASESARFSLPEVNLAITPSWGGTLLLPRKLTVNQAKELLFFGQPIDAQEAWRLGIVNQVFPQEGFFQAVEDRALRLAAKPAQALRGIKHLLSQTILDAPPEKALAAEHQWEEALMSSPAFFQAVEDFRRK